MQEMVKITVSPTGKASVEVLGASGEGCLAATQAIEKAMGDVDDRRKKPEYYQGTIQGTSQVAQDQI